ncbi:MAG TPA: hypothetical protein DCX75_10340, partial [Brevundimonas sp.]|nr:hypothetical protein [Brevundimonas sp.]
FSGNPFETYTPAQLVGLSVFAIAPALFILITGFLAAELARMADRTRGIDGAVRRLAAPVDTAPRDVSNLAGAITSEVERINVALESALARLAAMEEVIAHHADALEQSAGSARDRAEALLEGLRGERTRLSEVTDSLDDKAALIAAAISDQ